jgi:hypothetical protein
MKSIVQINTSNLQKDIQLQTQNMMEKQMEKMISSIIKIIKLQKMMTSNKFLVIENQ